MSVLANAFASWRPREGAVALMLDVGGQSGAFDMPLPMAKRLLASLDVAIGHGEAAARGLLPVDDRRL